MPDPEQIIAQKRQRMHQIEAAYIRTKEYLKSSEWHVKRDAVLMQLSSTMGQYRQGQDATAAVFVLGQSKQIMLEVQQITDVITEFESLQEEVRRYNERNG